MDRRKFIATGIAGLLTASIPFDLFKKLLHERKFEGVSGTNLTVANIWPEVKDYLTSEVIAAMEKRQHSDLVLQFNREISDKEVEERGYSKEDMLSDDDKYYVPEFKLVQSVGLMVKDIDYGIPKLAEILTDLHNRYGLDGNLAPALVIPMVGGYYSLVSYVAFDNKNYKTNLIEDGYEYSFKEGQRPKVYGCSDEELKLLEKLEKERITQEVSKLNFEIVKKS